MDSYFETVIGSLSIDDMYVLGVLHENSATVGYRAMPNQEILEQVKFTDSTYRRIMSRLCANKLIETVTIKKQNLFYLNEYGVAAVSKVLERVGA